MATSGTHRLKQLPQVPTIASAGIPGYDVTIWYGLLGSARLPPTSAARIQSDVASVLALGDVQTRLESLGVQPFQATSAEFRQFMERDQVKYGKIVNERGIKMTS